MAFYDLIVLIDPDAPEERRSGALSEIESMLSSGGSVVAAQEWGTRRMAYEIDHRPEAAYHLFQIEAKNDLLERLRHNLKIMDGVLRFRIIRARAGAPEPQVPPDQASRREERPDQAQVAARAAADAPAAEDAPVEAPVEAPAPDTPPV
jgi:small subunit ribosomal protein S6